MPKNAPNKAKATKPYEPPAYKTEPATEGILRGLHATCKGGATFEHGTIWLGGAVKGVPAARVLRIPCRILSEIPDPPTAYDKQRITIFNSDTMAMRLCEALDQAIFKHAMDAGNVPDDSTFYGIINEGGYANFRIRTSDIANPLPSCPGGIKDARAEEPGLLSIEILGIYRMRGEKGPIFGPIYKIIDWEASQEAYDRGTCLAAKYLE